MNKLKLSYFAFILVLCIGLVIFDLYNFEYILLPLFLVIQIVGLILCACVNRFRSLIKTGFLSIVISLSILVLGEVVGKILNERNREDGMQLVSSLEEFKLSHNRYPESLSGVPALASKVSSKRLPSRARYVYKAMEDGNSYFLEIQTFPIGFVKWNRMTHNWEDEML